MTLIAYQDPNHSGNAVSYHTGKPCIEKGCEEPAGTAWGPHWCFAHNVARLDRISANLNEFSERAKFSEMAEKAADGWRGLVEKLLRERDAIIRAAGGKVTVTKAQLEAKQTYWSHQSHKDGSQTYRINLT